MVVNAGKELMYASFLEKKGVDIRQAYHRAQPLHGWADLLHFPDSRCP